MAKATHAVKRVAAARKVRPAFALNAVAATFLRAHRALLAAEHAYEAAAVREHGKRWFDASYRDGLVSSPSTEARAEAVQRRRRALERRANTVIAKVRSKRRPTASDVLLLGMAGWHSLKAYHALAEAVPRVAGIDMEALA